jgi:1-aminocyclopropane-1-carboxylate deaminase/D-cysteine desulfhydrase-like pyridoxal-dependent ACC family enzyme
MSDPGASDADSAAETDSLVPGHLPRAGIGSFPTPVEEAFEFGAALGVPDLYLKREDRAGDQYGGNKIRKLNFLLGDALSAGCSRVLTSGGIGSHHVLATCVYARELGLAPAAVQFPQPVTDHVRENLRALASTDPDLTLAGSVYRMPYHYLRMRLTARRDDELYYVPTGGSSPTGTLGFVEAAGELERQIRRGELPEPDVIVVPASSGGTLAGLQVGLDQTSLETRVVGVRVVEWYAGNRFSVARLANSTASLLGLPANYGWRDVDLLSGYLGEGYAEPSARGERAQTIAADYDIELDPTYTAKTVAAIAGEFDDERVLYWHTLSSRQPEPLSTDAALERLPDSYRRFVDRET